MYNYDVSYLPTIVFLPYVKNDRRRQPSARLQNYPSIT